MFLRGRGKINFEILPPLSTTLVQSLSSSFAILSFVVLRKVFPAFPETGFTARRKAAVEFVRLSHRQNCAIRQLLPNDKIINTKNNKPPVLCLPCGRFSAKLFPWIFLRTLGSVTLVRTRASYPLYLSVPMWSSGLGVMHHGRRESYHLWNSTS